MAGFGDNMRRLEDRPNPMLVLGLGAGVVALLFAAIIGAVAVGKEDVEDQSLVAGPAAQTGDATSPDAAVDPALGTDTTLPGTDPAATTGGASGGTTAKAPGSTAGTSASRPPAFKAPPGAALPSGVEDRTGVFKDRIEVRWHAPKTFDGQPLNLAEDPIEGLTYYQRDLNANGGVHGRKIKGGENADEVIDDRYTVAGGAAAGDKIVEAKPFFAVGTLGVDQINQVASRARKAGIPYMAAGGSEELFKSIGMFQIAASYDTHFIKLADYLGKETKTASSPYFNKTVVGVTRLDSDFIGKPVDTTLKSALQRNGLTLKTVVKIQKPTEQTTYNDQLSDLRSSGVQIVISAQDPISTGRMTKECGDPPSGPGQGTSRCPWMWTFSNFANESDVALALMGGHWGAQKVRGLAGGCYYMPKGVGKPYDPAFCGSMHKAHDIWVRQAGELEWQKDGQGGASGYQLTYIWVKALKDAGPDPTREKFLAAMLAYDEYNDLVSGPITFKGSQNIAHGADKMVPFEAQLDTTYQQLTPGFVDSF